MLPDEARLRKGPKGGTGYSGRSGALPVNDGSWTVNGERVAFEGGGYTPRCFVKSEKVAWNQQVAAGVFLRVCKSLITRGLRVGLIRRGMRKRG